MPAAVVAKPAPPAPKPVAIFPDKNLEAAVRRQVFAKRDGTEPLYAADVENVAIIEGRGMGIKDLTGLEKCVALAQITLPKNSITSIAPLKGLERLQFIDLSDNQVQDISVLSTLKSLQFIELTRNKVQDVTALGGVIALNSLYLAHNQIKDLSPLFKLPKVWTIDAEGNQITAITGIGGLKWLSMLNLKGNQVADITPLEPLAELQQLFLDGNKITDLAPLHRMMKKDFEGTHEWAPYCNVYLAGNALSDASKKLVEELVKLGARIQP